MKILKNSLMESMVKRKIFEGLYEKYKKIDTSVILTDSTLLLLLPISLGKNDYEFNLLENEGIPHPSEVRLNQNDEFNVLRWAMGYASVIIDPTSPLTEVESLKSLFYHTSPLKNSNVSARGILSRLFDAVIEIEINGKKYLEKYKTLKFFSEDNSIYTRLSNKPDLALIPFQYSENSLNVHKNAVELTPIITLSGSKKNKIRVSLPNPLVIDNINSTDGLYTVDFPAALESEIKTRYIFLYLEGFNAQNQSKFQ